MTDIWSDSGAVFDASATYRYRLWRRLSPDNRSRVVWVLLNPSTANAALNDPTIRRCIGFSRAWGYGYMDVVNLFAWRATDPKVLWHPDLIEDDLVGSENDIHIADACSRAGLVVCGWGTRGVRWRRDRAVLDLVASSGARPHALGVTKEGHPCHPLYLKGDAQPVPFPGAPCGGIHAEE